MMRVISNTSPLQYLYAIKQLDLLMQLYGEIIVPQSVVAELQIGQQQGYDVPNCSAYPWMLIESVPIPATLQLITNLGPGEAEVLALALASPTDLVILDDALARQVAASQNISYTGTLGVLIQGKQQGLITTVMPLVEMMEQAGFRIHATLKTTIRARRPAHRLPA